MYIRLLEEDSLLKLGRDSAANIDILKQYFLYFTVAETIRCMRTTQVTIDMNI